MKASSVSLPIYTVPVTISGAESLVMPVDGYERRTSPRGGAAGRPLAIIPFVVATLVWDVQVVFIFAERKSVQGQEGHALKAAEVVLA